MLLMEVNSCGFFGTFDFLYLPIGRAVHLKGKRKGRKLADTETAANRGYAFLNFLDPPSAWMFRCMFEGRKMSRFNSRKAPAYDSRLRSAGIYLREKYPILIQHSILIHLSK